MSWLRRLFTRPVPDAAVWSIGVYAGDSPLRLFPAPNVRNPVLTRHDVSDVPAAFVADPFMLRTGGDWHMFFEVYNSQRRKGEIALATSRNGMEWTYERVVLAEPFHLSYPYVFEWMSEFYMVPESYQDGAVRLYRAAHFPTSWSLVSRILTGPYLVDPSVFRWRDRWWLFVDTSPRMKHDTLRLYHAADLTGPWLEHPRSPIVTGNPRAARPAGRVQVLGSVVVRFAQGCLPEYGTEVRAFEIEELTTERFAEREVVPAPLLGPSGTGWNASGMHHVDGHLLDEGAWLACVDGWRPRSPDLQA